MTLLQLSAGRPFLTDGGLETSLVFRDGIDLPDFAAFPLLDSDARSRCAGPLLRAVSRSRRGNRIGLRPRHPDVASQSRLGRPPGLRRHPPGSRQSPRGRVRHRAGRRTPRPAARDQRSHRPPRRRLCRGRCHVGVGSRRLPRAPGPSLRGSGVGDDQRHHHDLRRGSDRCRPRRHRRIAARGDLVHHRDRRTAALRADTRRRDRPGRRSNRRHRPPTTW